MNFASSWSVQESSLSNIETRKVERMLLSPYGGVICSSNHCRTFAMISKRSFMIASIGYIVSSLISVSELTYFNTKFEFLNVGNGNGLKNLTARES